jgi:hypothetical protein
MQRSTAIIDIPNRHHYDGRTRTAMAKELNSTTKQENQAKTMHKLQDGAQYKED